MSGNGHAITGTPIAVDLWNKLSCPQARLFFLSHFHGDHISGLTSAWDYPIYTSPITGQLLLKKLKIKPSIVHSLEIGEDHLIPLDFEGHEMVTVRLFDANHCPGSVMFLFSGYFGNILYTGDFRYSPLMNFDTLPKIDVLYLDNTYCSPKCTFPTKEAVVDSILQKLHICLQHSKRVFLGMDNLGKEELLVKIAKETRCKMCVSSQRKEILNVLGLSDIVTTDGKDCKVFVVSTNQISGHNIEKWNAEVKTCAILATARFCGFNFIPYSRQENIHVFPYSNHSSYEELLRFVKLICPRAIIPVVGKHVQGIFGIDISDRADMSVFGNFVDNSVRADFVIPLSVKKAMNLWTENSKVSAFDKRKKSSRTKETKRLKSRAGGLKFLNKPEQESEEDEIVNFDDKASNSNISENEESVNPCDKVVWEIVHITGARRPKILHTV